MSRRGSIRIFAFVFLLMHSCALAQSDDWKKVSEKDGLAVYNRISEGFQIYEVKGVFELDHPAPQVAAAVWDLNQYSGFMPFTAASKVLAEEPVGPKICEAVFFTVIEPPLVSSRYYTLDLRLQRDFEGRAGVFHISWTMSSKDDVGLDDPRVKNLIPKQISTPIKVKMNMGYWLLEPVPEKKTKITYYVKTDPGGGLPPVIINKANLVALPKLRDAMTKRLSETKYDIQKDLGCGK